MITDADVVDACETLRDFILEPTGPESERPARLLHHVDRVAYVLTDPNASVACEVEWWEEDRLYGSITLDTLIAQRWPDLPCYWFPVDPLANVDDETSLDWSSACEDLEYFVRYLHALQSLDETNPSPVAATLRHVFQHHLGEHVRRVQFALTADIYKWSL